MVRLIVKYISIYKLKNSLLKMGEGSRSITIRETNKADVAYALAHLAGFPKGTFVGETNNVYHRELSSRCEVVFHRDTLTEAGGENPMLFLGPDIVVTKVHKPSAESGRFEPTDEYLIDFGPRVDADLIGRIEGEIRLAYSGAGI